MTEESKRFADMLEQALIELNELRASIEYDEEFMEGIPAVIVPLENHVKALLAAVKESRHVYNGADLPFMELVNRVNKTYLPFKQLFIDINKLHLALSAGGDSA